MCNAVYPVFEKLETRVLLSGAFGEEGFTAGDANTDGSVNWVDSQVVMTHMGATGTNWSDGDFNSNAMVDASDYIALKRNMGNTEAVSAILDSQGILSILGTSQDDNLVLSGVDGHLLLSAGPVQTVIAGDVQSLLLHTLAGNDIVRIDHSVTAALTAYLGGGDDVMRDNGLCQSTIWGGDGQDLIVTIGGGSDTVHGGSGKDSFWIDSSDMLVDEEASEHAYNVHLVTEFYQPFTTEHVSLEIMGQNYLDPTDESVLRNYSDTPLFSDGPEYNDIVQGSLGDCYFLSAVSSLAYSDPDIVRESIVDLGDGSYAVRFITQNTPTYLRVDADLPVAGSSLKYARLSPDGETWVAIMEKAYCFFRYKSNTYASLSGGHPGSVFSQVTGAVTTYYNSLASATETFNNITDALSNGHAVSAISYLGATSPVVANHAYTVVNAEIVDGTMFITVFNPWGNDGRSWDGDYYDGLLRLDIDLFISNFNSVCASSA